MEGREITYLEAITEALRLEMRQDPTVIIMGEDIAGWPADRVKESRTVGVAFMGPLRG